MFVKKVSQLARFNPDRMGKSTLAAGDFLFTGLNSFEAGQEHAAHVHEGQDKLYFVLEGDAEVRIGDQTQKLGPGDAALARSGVVHAIRNPGPDRLVVMTVMGPPPSQLG
jgi:mannose-6-phosphate isomerase-like protein (cupin superfamily)